MFEKIGKFLRSENGLKGVNSLFILLALLGGSELGAVENVCIHLPWLMILLYSVGCTQRKALKGAYFILLVYAAVMLVRNLSELLA